MSREINYALFLGPDIFNNAFHTFIQNAFRKLEKFLCYNV